MTLLAYALTTIESVKIAIGITDDDIQIPVISIYNSSSDATAATYQVTTTGIRLIVTGGANAHDTTLTFADVNKDTIAELVTYITGTLVKGWNVKVITNGSQASSDLTQTDTTSCLLFLNRKNLYAPNNPYIESLINAATSFIERYCGRRFKKTTYTNELIDGDDSQFLFLDNFPIISVTTIYWHDVISGDELLDSDYYKIYSAEGYIYRDAGWTLGKQNIKITYAAGYDFTTDGIPADLQDICNSLVNSKYTVANKLGIKSEQIGQYAVTYSDKDLNEEIKASLDLWRKPNVF